MVQSFSTHQVVHDVNEDVVVGVKQLREVEQHLFQNVAVAPLQVRQLVKKSSCLGSSIINPLHAGKFVVC